MELINKTVTTRQTVSLDLRLKERELPLTSLRAFAIAAHAPNLASAAKQLGVTHGAVSKQIVLLEEWLGQALFTRHKRILELTPYGRILAERVSASIRDIGAACAYVRRDRSRKVISVEAPVTLHFISCCRVSRRSRRSTMDCLFGFPHE